MRDVKNKIKEWSILTNSITEKFLYDYFDDTEPYYFWVSDEVGGILNYGDYWFNFSDILTCYKLGITYEQLINWYDFCIKNHSVKISLARYVLSPQERKEKEQKHLQELKERVMFAEEEFKKALKEYEK